MSKGDNSTNENGRIMLMALEKNSELNLLEISCSQPKFQPVTINGLVCALKEDFRWVYLKNFKCEKLTLLMALLCADNLHNRFYS